MSGSSISSTSETEDVMFNVDQWKVELVETFFDKTNKCKVIKKSALVYEDCDISNISENCDVEENKEVMNTKVTADIEDAKDVGKKATEISEICVEFYDDIEKIEDKEDITGQLKGSPTPTVACTPSVLNENCQIKSCVSVILKSSRLVPKAARLSLVARRQFQIERFASLYRLKFGHKTSPGVQVRMDYCFQQPGEAAQFYNSVLTLEQALAGPKFVSCFLLSESELGYQHRPVLTEQDLLAIQSSVVCRNLFRTCILIKVIQEGDTVVYHFKTVTDVNKFLFNKSKTSSTRSLGMLRMNVTPKKLAADQDGFFRLFSAEKNICAMFGRYKRFKIKPGDGGNYLLFSSRLDLFKFLVSEPGSTIDHLQFDEKKIENLRENKEEDKTEPHENNSCQPKKEGERLWIDVANKNDIEVKRSISKKINVLNYGDDDVEDVENIKPANIGESENIVDDQLKTSVNGEPVVIVNEAEKVKINNLLALKEEEIKSLKRKLMLKENMIQTKFLEKTAANSNLKEVFSQLEKIHQLTNSVVGKR